MSVLDYILVTMYLLVAYNGFILINENALSQLYTSAHAPLLTATIGHFFFPVFVSLRARLSFLSLSLLFLAM